MAQADVVALMAAAKKFMDDSGLLQDLRDQKVQHQNAIQDLNTQITAMVDVVAASKAALKAAANLI